MELACLVAIVQGQDFSFDDCSASYFPSVYFSASLNRGMFWRALAMSNPFQIRSVSQHNT